ncbi:MFS transporter [Salinibacillus xinjiangensis]|uniref:MFS transporter n=1 Tax=Salinibacillus xinjiangensis TaxID=1229268 RepID=A0A6G1X8J4_9BACI|nr:MFS transporter [Salinibacillus xinjiangensis]MRG87226.1 MFS transporter [Salinibacillus xinjiangensis]
MANDHTKAKVPIQSSFYYGWVIVAVAALSVFFSGPGQTYSISIFKEYYIEDFGYSNSFVSGLYSVATLLAGSLLFVVGRLTDKFGQRTMMTAIGILLAVTCFWNSFIFGPVMMFIGFFMLRIFGQGSMTLLPNTLVPQWFMAKRGKALSLMAIGTFVSSALFPPLNTFLNNTIGWRYTWVFWGVLLLVIFVPIAFVFVRNKPEDVGLEMDGKKTNYPVRTHLHVDVSEVSWTVKEAMRTRAFWFILFCVSVPALVNTGVTFHIVSIAEGKGLTAGHASMILSLMAIIGFPLSFVSGYLVDRYQVKYVLAITFLGHIISILMLWQVSSVVGAVIYGVLWGIVNGLERIVLNIVWPNYFGREHLGSIKGIAQSVMVLGSALGPLPFGLFYDWYHGYDEILLIIILFPLTAGILSLLASKPVYKK